jgi:hypothetical protein
MLDKKRKARYEERFAAIESSFRIEGMDPSGDPVYEAAKARVLAGAETPKQALAFAIKRSASAPVSAAASR